MPTPSWDSQIFYRILVPNATRRVTKFMSIVALQDFDLTDYNNDEWLRESGGIVGFDSEQEARQYLADNVDEKWIHRDDQLVQNSVDFYRRSDD